MQGTRKGAAVAAPKIQFSPSAFRRSITPVRRIRKAKLKAEKRKIYWRDFWGA